MTELLEQRVRETCRLKAATVECSDDAYARITGRVRRPRWWELSWARAAAAGLAAGVAIATLGPAVVDTLRPGPDVLFTEPGREAVAPAPQPTSADEGPRVFSEPAPGVDVDELTWTRVADAEVLAAGEFTEMSDISRTAAGFVAVGSTSDPALSPAGTRGAFWRSRDGREWECLDCGVDPRGIVEVLAVHPLGETGFVAVGQAHDAEEPSVPFAWVSEDGSSIAPIELPGSGIVRAVTFTGQRWVAVGEEGESRAAAVWTSADARDWQLQSLGGDGVEGVADHVAAADGRVVALARDGVHVSTDGGARWTFTPAGDAGLGDATAFEDLIAAPDGGFFLASVGQEQGPRLFRSVDGSSWEPVAEIAPALDGNASRVNQLLVTADGGLVAVGSGPNDAGGRSGAAWASTDAGQTWAPFETAAFAPGFGPQAVVERDGGLVAVGSAEDADLGSVAAVWLATPPAPGSLNG
ncbi:MAG: hypothetical protein H0V93_11435 [Euzebyales bacterium]|nr:hypothetical protein [Euzebyales bacterium]